MNAASSSHETFHRRQVLRNRRDEIERAERDILDEMDRRQFGNASIFAVRLAIEEALSNAFKHGNKDDPGKTVLLESSIDDQLVSIEICDEGDGFDPEAVPDPTAVENVEIPSGRGLKLIRSFMHEVRILPPGNRLQMRFIRPDRSGT